MNVPLSWLSEYVKLPPTKTLTDKLTMVGHMLDKISGEKDTEVIDLELRGNRPDMFGLIGVAREVAAAFNHQLLLPQTTALPSTDPSSRLVTVEAEDLVERFVAVVIKVNVGPSPAWLKERLESYGITSINNVVDITNYVMVETGEPMHAYDRDKLSEGRLILRRAKKGERMTTLLGEVLSLTPDDLVIADAKKPQGMTMIGSKHSGVTDTTSEIILEAAVYNQANVRRTARRLGIQTEAGTRHEKLLDPNMVPPALERALYLLQQEAGAKVHGKTADYYVKKRDPVTIQFDLTETQRLCDITMPQKDVIRILESLGCSITRSDPHLHVTVPTWRTDIEQSADIVEELVRMYGYEHVSSSRLTGTLPPDQTDPSWKLEETVRDAMIRLQSNEVITSSIIANDWIPLYQHTGAFTGVVTLVNPPDQQTATMRPTMLPNLVEYAKRSFGFRQRRLSFFEIGRIYRAIADGTYEEEDMLGVLQAGTIGTRSWGGELRQYTVFDVKGLVEGLMDILGLHLIVRPESSHPSLSPAGQGGCYIGETRIGTIGTIHPEITGQLGVSEPLYVAELSLNAIAGCTRTGDSAYILAPKFPPIIEDVSFIVSDAFLVGDFISAVKQLDPLITSVSLLDAYEDKRTFTIRYSHPDRTLSSESITPLRDKIIALAQEKFGARLVGT